MIMTKKTMVKMERTKVIKEWEEKEFYWKKKKSIL